MGFTGITIVNESEADVMACLSQLTPLHWSDKIAPGESKKLNCGRVWFTLSVGVYNKSHKPTYVGTGARLTAIVGSAVLTGPFWPVALIATSTASGLTSTVSGRSKKNAPGESFKVDGAIKRGVYANDRVYVIKGVHKPNGVYELYFDQWSRDDGHITHLCRRRPRNLPNNEAPPPGYVEYSTLVVDGRVVDQDPSTTSSQPLLTSQQDSTNPFGPPTKSVVMT